MVIFRRGINAREGRVERLVFLHFLYIITFDEIIIIIYGGY